MKKPSRCNTSKKLDPGKAQCQIWHFKKRIRERLKINLTDENIDQIISCIKKKKENTEFNVKFVEKQSNTRLLYEITFKDKEPVNIVYDSVRGSVVTVLFPEDAQNIYHYFDIFHNKVNIKHDFGKIWKLRDSVLDIPGETVLFSNGIWEVTDGTLKGKKFKLDCEELLEII